VKTRSAARPATVRRAAMAKPCQDHGRADCAPAKSESDRLAEHIQRVVDAAPPLSPDQRDRLAVLLRGAGVPK